MNAAGLPMEVFPAFVLVLVRVAAVVMTLPVFSSRSIPAVAKVGVSALLAFAITSTLGSALPALPTTALGFVLAIAQELLMGLVFGFSVQVIFSGIQMAGQLLGIQMGLNIATTLDPVTQGQQISYIDQLYALLAGMVFLTIDGHHWLIQALAQSFSIVPLGQFTLSEGVSTDLVRMLTQAVVISIRIGLPVSAALLLTDVAFLIIGRTAPQMNIFFVGQPVKIGVGLVAFFVALPVMIGLMAEVLRGLNNDVMQLMRAVS